jgi:hypothetical protein
MINNKNEKGSKEYDAPFTWNYLKHALTEPVIIQSFSSRKCCWSIGWWNRICANVSSKEYCDIKRIIIINSPNWWPRLLQHGFGLRIRTIAYFVKLVHREWKSNLLCFGSLIHASPSLCLWLRRSCFPFLNCYGRLGCDYDKCVLLLAVYVFKFFFESVMKFGACPKSSWRLPYILRLRLVQSKIVFCRPWWRIDISHYALSWHIIRPSSKRRPHSVLLKGTWGKDNRARQRSCYIKNAEQRDVVLSKLAR